MIRASSILALLLSISAIAFGQTSKPQPTTNPFESPNVLTPQIPIDQYVQARLRQSGIQPAYVCSDAVFVRRIYLDLIGTLPSAKEAADFLQDSDPAKRKLLIDRLMERPEFIDYWTLKWSDLLRVKSEFPINLWPNAVQAYSRWIRTCIKDNVPYDRFVRQMLTSSGSNFREPPVNFYRAVQSKEPPGLAQAVALTFMGVRAENWPKERLAGMAGFFSQIGFKSTTEWKEEIVFFDPTKATAGAIAVFPDGIPATLSPGRDPREIFADWLITPQNPWFTRNIANRVWSWFLGRGIIHEPDDIRPDNLPRNPELLAYLERELVSSHYNIKHLFRLILNSKTYQLSSIPRSNHPDAEACFAAYPLRRLEAEVLADALNKITGTTEKYTSPIPEPFTFIPEDQRSIALSDGSITSPFLEMFGRPPRDTGWESERNNRPSPDQRLHFLNSSHIQRKIQSSRKLQDIVTWKRKPRDVVDDVYLSILSRHPTDEEFRITIAYARPAAGKSRDMMDLVWALINSDEFLYRH